MWAAPETLRTPEGLAVFVEHPQVVEAELGTALIGSWGAEVDSMPRALTVGFTITSNGVVRSIPLPVERERWGAPRVAPRRDGRLAALWIPEDSSGARSLYAADFHRGRWGPATTIDVGIPLIWSSVSASAIVSSGGELRMVVPANYSLPAGAVLLLRSDSVWRSLPLAVENLRYPRLLADGADTMLLAYVAGESPYGNTLFVRRVTVDGDSAGPRVRVSVPGAGPVHYPGLESAGDSLIYLVWALQDTTGFIGRIGLATSRDRGRSWHVRRELAVAGGFDILRSAVDHRGRLHVVMRGVRDGNPHPMHLLWMGEEWRSSSIPAAVGLTSAGHPFLLFASDGSYRIMWGAAGYGATSLPAPISMFSAGRETCAHDSAAPSHQPAIRTGSGPAGAASHHSRGESRQRLSPGLGTHLSVRGTASPRAGRSIQTRGNHASISGNQPGPDARSERLRPRLRGPPRHAARARG